MIHFTRHALEKFAILERHGFSVSRAAVMRTIEDPEYIDHPRMPLKIAQRGFDKRHVLRVVYSIQRGG